jgi:hypothetical protein
MKRDHVTFFMTATSRSSLSVESFVRRSFDLKSTEVPGIPYKELIEVPEAGIPLHFCYNPIHPNKTQIDSDAINVRNSQLFIHD